MSNCPVDKGERTRPSLGDLADLPSLVPFFLFSLRFFSFSFFFFLLLWRSALTPTPTRRRLIFNYGAADSRTRNTFIVIPENAFENPDWNLSAAIERPDYARTLSPIFSPRTRFVPFPFCAWPSNWKILGDDFVTQDKRSMDSELSFSDLLTGFPVVFIELLLTWAYRCSNWQLINQTDRVSDRDV